MLNLVRYLVWAVGRLLLGLRYRVEVAGLDQLEGVHGKALVGHHDGHSSDIHDQRHPDADAGGCALLTTYHQPASAYAKQQQQQGQKGQTQSQAENKSG